MKNLRQLHHLSLLLVNIICVLLFESCNNAIQDVSLQEGDLLFQCSGASSFSEAITEATSADGGGSYDHVGIFTTEGGKPMVLEASSDKGVVLTPLKDFVAACPRVVAMRISPEVSATEAVARAREYLGKPYDWEFDADNDLLYCSELVQVSYLNADGTPVFPSVEMNFLDSDGNMPQFWTELFMSLGKEIPQGAPGTNPNSLAASPLLHPVKKPGGATAGRGE